MLKILNTSVHGLSYGDGEIMFVMEKLAVALLEGRKMARKSISMETGIGEGTVRTILGRLGAMGLLDIEHQGVTLSTTGSEFLKRIGVKLMDLEHTSSAIGTYQVSVLLRGKAHMIDKGVEQRDSGLKGGGDGCTTIVCRDGRLILPPDWNIDEKSPDMASRIRSYGIAEGDIVLIGGSNTGVREAANAANTAVLELTS
jgi:hypothetical protein